MPAASYWESTDQIILKSVCCQMQGLLPKTHCSCWKRKVPWRRPGCGVVLRGARLGLSVRALGSPSSLHSFCWFSVDISDICQWTENLHTLWVYLPSPRCYKLICACATPTGYPSVLDKCSCAPRFRDQRVHGLSIRILFERNLLENDATRHRHV